ncbi:MAG: hypothetical protein AAF267_01210 [Deinococcota bacterium]
MALTSITIAFGDDDMTVIRQEADRAGLSVSMYLQLLYKQHLQPLPDASVRQRQANALRDFSESMASAASPSHTGSIDAVRLAKAARKRLANDSKIKQ